MKKYLFTLLMLTNCGGIYYQEEFERSICGVSYETTYSYESFNAGWSSTDDFNDSKCWKEIKKKFERN